jgi:hypothetical protein
MSGEGGICVYFIIKRRLSTRPKNGNVVAKMKIRTQT